MRTYDNVVVGKEGISQREERGQNTVDGKGCCGY